MAVIKRERKQKRRNLKSGRITLIRRQMLNCFRHGIR